MLRPRSRIICTNLVQNVMAKNWLSKLRGKKDHKGQTTWKISIVKTTCYINFSRLNYPRPISEPPSPWGSRAASPRSSTHGKWSNVENKKKFNASNHVAVRNVITTWQKISNHVLYKFCTLCFRLWCWRRRWQSQPWLRGGTKGTEVEWPDLGIFLT